MDLEEALNKIEKTNIWIDEQFDRMDEIQNYGFFKQLFYSGELKRLLNKTKKVIVLNQHKMNCIRFLQIMKINETRT